jgi:VanZ family protein
VPTCPAINQGFGEDKSLTRTHLARLTKIALAVYWLALVVATHIPPSTNLPSVETSDKLLHGVAYMILAFLLAAAWELSVGRLNGRHLVVAWLAVIAWAAIDEITQIPVGRVADFWDWMADAGGVAIGILLFVGVRRLIVRKLEQS